MGFTCKNERIDVVGRSVAEWPDLAKNRHFGNILRVFGNFWRVFRQTVSQCWQMFLLLGKFWMIKMANYWKNILAIWSHWSVVAWRKLRFHWYRYISDKTYLLTGEMPGLIRWCIGPVNRDWIFCCVHLCGHHSSPLPHLRCTVTKTYE